MVASTQTKFVIVTPDRVAYTTPQAKEKFTSRPKQVIWTPYLQELFAVHGDIQVVESPAKLLAAQQAEKTKAKPAAASPAPKVVPKASLEDKELPPRAPASAH